MFCLQTISILACNKSDNRKPHCSQEMNFSLGRDFIFGSGRKNGAIDLVSGGVKEFDDVSRSGVKLIFEWLDVVHCTIQFIILRNKSMGTASSMLTQYDIEDVQHHCNNLFSQQEIVSLYQRFCQLDRSAKGFISADEFLSVPEFATNPLSQRLLKMVDGLNFKDFVAFLSAFSSKASMTQKIELIFKVYDSDYNGKVTFKDILEVLRDLTGTFMSDQQREEVLIKVLQEAGYSRESSLLLDDFVKILNHPGIKMEVEVPID